VRPRVVSDASIPDGVTSHDAESKDDFGSAFAFATSLPIGGGYWRLDRATAIGSITATLRAANDWRRATDRRSLGQF
jgi:hypothetical protein